MELSNTIIDQTVNFNNDFLKNDYLRIALLLIICVFMGYV